MGPEMCVCRTGGRVFSDSERGAVLKTRGSYRIVVLKQDIPVLLNWVRTSEDPPVDGVKS